MIQSRCSRTQAIVERGSSFDQVSHREELPLPEKTLNTQIFSIMSKVVKPDLSAATRSVKLICVNVARNNNKQWAAWVLPNGDLYSENGRVGYAQTPHLKSFGTAIAAEKALEKLIADKRAKDYVFVTVEESPQSGLNFSELGEDYAEQIGQQFSQLAAQSEFITRHTAIQFEQERGLFVTQMGVISAQAVTKATNALQQVENALEHQGQHSNNNRRYIQAVEEYLATIPLQVGMRLDPRQVLGNSVQIREQFAVLLRLSDCLNQVKAIRVLIERAMNVMQASGSDERARWLRWGKSPEADSLEEAQPANTEEAGEDRAQWVRW